MRCTLSILLVTLVACGSETAPSPDVAEGRFDVINSDYGDDYPQYCGSLATCASSGVRLLEQFVGDPEEMYTCRATDRDSRCGRNSQHDAYVKDCEKLADGIWECEFGISGLGGDDVLGAVRLENPVYRFEFWDGAVGVGSVMTHSFDYLPARRTSRLPIK